jgi:hypothetical protein
MRAPLFGIVVLLAMTMAAQARPRDEVMSRVFGCAGVADGRAWLHCYYGAAQPARAALGMSPAPAAQTRLAASPSAGTVSPADTVLRDGVIAQAFRCNALGDDRQWLNCYYAAAGPARERLGLMPVPAQSPRPAPARPDDPASQPFGLPTRQPEADRIASRMKSYSFDGYGVFVVTLENGQVWRQVSGDNVLAHWNRPASRYDVRITRGVLGSFNLQVKNSPGLFKVRRIG